MSSRQNRQQANIACWPALAVLQFIVNTHLLSSRSKSGILRSFSRTSAATSGMAMRSSMASRRSLMASWWQSGAHSQCFNRRLPTICNPSMNHCITLCAELFQSMNMFLHFLCFLDTDHKYCKLKCVGKNSIKCKIRMKNDVTKMKSTGNGVSLVCKKYFFAHVGRANSLQSILKVSILVMRLKIINSR